MSFLVFSGINIVSQFIQVDSSTMKIPFMFCPFIHIYTLKEFKRTFYIFPVCLGISIMRRVDKSVFLSPFYLLYYIFKCAPGTINQTSIHLLLSFFIHLLFFFLFILFILLNVVSLFSPSVFCNFVVQNTFDIE